MELRLALDLARANLAVDLGIVEQEVLKAIYDAYKELEHAINWDTSCLNCASLLDKNYEQYVKLDKVRAVLGDEL